MTFWYRQALKGYLDLFVFCCDRVIFLLKKILKIQVKPCIKVYTYTFYNQHLCKEPEAEIGKKDFFSEYYIF